MRIKRDIQRQRVYRWERHVMRRTITRRKWRSLDDAPARLMDRRELPPGSRRSDDPDPVRRSEMEAQAARSDFERTVG